MSYQNHPPYPPTGSAPPYPMGGAGEAPPGMGMPMPSIGFGGPGSPPALPPKHYGDEEPQAQGYAYPPVPIPYQPPIQQQPTHDQGYPPYGAPYPYHSQPSFGYGPAGAAPHQPIHMQPQLGQTVPLNVPSGLEFLVHLDRLFVKQKVELLEAFLGCETKNKYKIKDAQGRDLYTAKEDTDCCTRNCCGSNRPFDLPIKDMNGREIIHISRPLACTSCWFPCCLQSMEVQAPPGNRVGSIEQEWSIFTPKFLIKNALGETVLRIEGPFCTYSICGDVEFQVLSSDGAAQVGKISKKWSGLAREAFTDADNFGINFPMDLDVKMKAVMLGACFLIDFMFFEKAGNKEGDGIGMWD